MPFTATLTMGHRNGHPRKLADHVMHNLGFYATLCCSHANSWLNHDDLVDDRERHLLRAYFPLL